MPTKVCLVKAMVFQVVVYRCESWTIKKAECWRIDAFELWCWRKLLRVPWTARRSNQSILKEISPEYSLEGLTLKLKLQYFDHLMQRTDYLEKTLTWEWQEGGEGDDRGWHGWMTSPTPGVHPNPCPLSQWCHPTISSSVVPFSSRPQSLPASGSFQMSQLLTSGGQSIGVSASASVLPMNIQDWFPLGWTGCIFCCPRDSQESSPTPQFKSINFSVLSFLYSPTLTSIHDYWKNHSLD